MKKTLLYLLVMFVIATSFTGCEVEQTAAKQQAEETNKVMNEMVRELGMPDITNFQQKKLLKKIYELCDTEGLICYAYLKCEYTGKLTFLTKCLGYGVPFSAQYTSPEKMVDRYGRVTKNSCRDVYIMPQADPNGLFMPTSSSATWLIVIDPKTNEAKPAYIEPEISVFPFKIPGIE